MNDKEMFQEDLNEGGELLWTGSPTSVKLLGTASKWKTLLLWLIGTAWLVVSFAVFLPKIIETDDSIVHMIIVMILLNCIPLLMLTMPFSDARDLSSQVLYAITSQRVIVQMKDRKLVMLLDPSVPVEIRSRTRDTGNVLLGSVVGKSDASLRSIALRGDDKGGKTTGLVLYHVEAPEAVRTILERVKRS